MIEVTQIFCTKATRKKLKMISAMRGERMMDVLDVIVDQHMKTHYPSAPKALVNK